jgi:hypothetical protein
MNTSPADLEQITAAIAEALSEAGMSVSVSNRGIGGQLRDLAVVLDAADIIDRRYIVDEACDTCEHGCTCTEWWAIK